MTFGTFGKFQDYFMTFSVRGEGREGWCVKQPPLELSKKSKRQGEPKIKRSKLGSQISDIKLTLFKPKNTSLLIYQVYQDTPLSYFPPVLEQTR